MPALYRMPVFYLVVLVGAVAYGFAHGLRPATVSTEIESESFDEAPRPIRVATDDEDRSTKDGILRTPEGLRRKVVVKDLAVVCRTDPSGGKIVGKPLDYFAIGFLYGEQPGQFQVGPMGGPPQGWVPSTSVLEWDTRLMARPTPRSGRSPLVIYRDESCLVDALAGRTCIRHEGRCPTEGEEPSDAPPPSTSEGPPLGFPILTSKSVDGQVIYEVASLVKDQAQAPILPSEPPPDLRPYLKVVDVAFAIDTTASMQSTIEAARRLAKDLVESASRRFGDVKLRFALVEYRDTDPRYGFKARTVTGFTSPEGFLASLNRTNAATRGDGSVDESVLDGLSLALPSGAGDPPGEHVNWPTGRAGELATKLLVLLGDAPDHARDLDRAKALASRAKAAGITIATVAIERPGMLSRDEQARYRDQWRTLAEESYRPLDKSTGFAEAVAPITASLQEGDRLAERLQSLIDDRVEHARTISAIATAEAEGKLGEYVNSQGLTLDRVAPVLVDLHRGDAARVARPDPRFDGRKAPSVRRGWIADAIAGKPMVSVEILMSREELKTLIDELTQLQQAASGTARDLSELIQIGTAAASGETSFLAADRGSRTFADHLRRRQGLPPAKPGSLLARSQSDLLRSDDLTLAALDAKLRESLLQLTRRLQAPDWKDPRRTIDGMALVPFEAIDF
jgi:von Willebrand factor type A domain